MSVSLHYTNQRSRSRACFDVVLAKQRNLLDHGLASEAVPGSHIEDACPVTGQVAHQGKPIDSAVATDRYCVHKGSEAQTISQSERDDTSAGQQSLCCHIDNGHLQHVHTPQL